MSKASLDCRNYPDFLSISDLLSEEQKMVQNSTRDFIKKEVSPLIREAYREEKFPSGVIARFGELGLLGCNLSGYGLPAMDDISYGLVMRELERSDSGLRSFASVQGSLVMYPIHSYGSEEQKQKWLPLLASGQAVGCFGLTEAQGGSDPSNMLTRAEKKKDHWLLSGAKMWITNGNLADIAIIWAVTAEGVRGFLLPMDSPGVKVQKMSGKLSLRASVTSELYFDQVKLPLDALLPGSVGLKSALSCLTQARYGICWGVLGAAEDCYGEACEYVDSRKLFGSLLSSKQLVQRKLALVLSQISSGQLLALRLGQLKNEKKLHHAQVSMGKQNNCEMACNVARVCRDILGGHGIMDECSVMRHLCNLETVFTYEGTSDIHLLVLGSQITGREAF